MKNWSLNSKLLLVFSILIFSNIFAVAVGLTKLFEMEVIIHQISEVTYKRIEMVTVIRNVQSQLALQIRDVMLATDPAEQKKYEAAIAENEKSLLKHAEDYKQAATEAGRKEMDKYLQEFNNWYKASHEVFELVHAGKQQEAVEFNRAKVAPFRLKMSETLDGIVDLNVSKMQDAVVTADESYAASRNQLILISFVSILFSVGLCFYVVTTFNRSIQGVISTLNDSANLVAGASQQLSSSSQDLSQATTEQASSLEETAASLEEISAMISKSADSAASTELSSNESQTKAVEGRQAVDQMVASIDEISHSNEAIMNQVNQSNQQMGEIVKVIQEIGNKTKVINEIVFQTKLLSFNASVEAARAGEHGKGFAVVAEEVGNLAQMSGNAAKEISDMLMGSISKVEQIVNETKTGVESLVAEGKVKVESGVTIARQCSGILDEIVKNVSIVTSLSREISQASREQAQGVSEINKAMTQLDTVTHQNTATSEEASSAAQNLAGQAATLKHAVGELIYTVRGRSATAPAAPMTAKQGLAAEKSHPAKPHAPKTTPKSNVVPMTAKKPIPAAKEKSVAATTMTGNQFKLASGEPAVPSSDDSGFQDM